jgi:hypothetical protein
MPPEPSHRLLSPFRKIAGGKAAGDGGANIYKSDQGESLILLWKGSLTKVALIKLRQTQLFQQTGMPRHTCFYYIRRKEWTSENCWKRSRKMA